MAYSIHNHGYSKVFISKQEIRDFNSTWPCSELKPTQGYWFEFDRRGDLVDSNIPDDHLGDAANAMLEDCYQYAFQDVVADWMAGPIKEKL